MKEVSFMEYMNITGYFIREKYATNRNYTNNEVDWIDKNGDIVAKRTKISNTKFSNLVDEETYEKFMKARR